MRTFAVVVLLLSLGACAFTTGSKAQGWQYFRAHVHPTGKCGGAREVAASVYNEPGGKTYTGERFDGSAHRAATPRIDGFPMRSHVHVRNPRNGRSITVYVNDRLPIGEAFHSGVRLDLTPAAHRALGMTASDWVCAQ